MGCASSAPTGQQPTEAPKIDKSQIEKSKASAVTAAPNAPSEAAVVSFTHSDAGGGLRHHDSPNASFSHQGSVKKSSGTDADMAEVDRLLSMPGSELQGHPLSLGSREEAPPTPPLPSRPAGMSTEETSSSDKAAPAPQGRDTQGSPPKAAKPPLARESPGGAKPEKSGIIAEDDPWASLQSKYKIGDRGSGNRAVPPLPIKRVTPTFDDDEDDVVVLDAGRMSDNGGSLKANGGGGGYVTPTAVKLAARPPPAAALGGAARAGGWGNGNLAAAGTLMLGDEPPSVVCKPPPKLPQASTRYDEEDDRKASFKSAGADDLGMEEIEDVDALLAEEMAAHGLNNDLAGKLARLEAMQDDDD